MRQIVLDQHAIGFKNPDDGHSQEIPRFGYDKKRNQQDCSKCDRDRDPDGFVPGVSVVGADYRRGHGWRLRTGRPAVRPGVRLGRRDWVLSSGLSVLWEGRRRIQATQGWIAG